MRASGGEARKLAGAAGGGWNGYNSLITKSHSVQFMGT